MRQEGGLGAVAQVQIYPKGEVRLALPARWFVFRKGHNGAFIVAVQAEDELALLHSGRQPGATLSVWSNNWSGRS